MWTCERVVAVGQAVHPDGVVEVARGFAVDGDDVQCAEIAAAGESRRRGWRRRERAACSSDLGREAVGQVVLADDDFDVDAEVVGAAEDLDDAADGASSRPWGTRGSRRPRSCRRGPAGEETAAGAAPMRSGRGRRGNFQPVGDVDPAADAVVVRDDEVAVAARRWNSPTTVGWARLRIRTISPSARPPGSMRVMRARTRSPCMACEAEEGARKMSPCDAFDGAVGDDEAVAVAVHVEAAGGVLAGVGGGDVVAGLELDEVAAGGEAVEDGFQLVAHGAVGAEFADELLEGGAGVRQALDVLDEGGFGEQLLDSRGVIRIWL